MKLTTLENFILNRAKENGYVYLNKQPDKIIFYKEIKESDPVRECEYYEIQNMFINLNMHESYLIEELLKGNKE